MYLSKVLPSGNSGLFLTQVAVGTVGCILLLTVLPVAIRNAAIETVNDGSAFDKFYLFLVIWVTGNVAVRIGAHAFYKIEWRSIPKTRRGRWIEEVLVGRLFYSVRTDLSDYRTLYRAAEEAWSRKTGIKISELSIAEREAVHQSIALSSQHPSSSETQRSLHWSEALSVFITVTMTCYVFGTVTGQVNTFVGIVAGMTLAGLLIMHLRIVRDNSMNLECEKVGRLANFLINQADSGLSSITEHTNDKFPPVESSPSENPPMVQDGSEPSQIAPARPAEPVIQVTHAQEGR